MSFFRSPAREAPHPDKTLEHYAEVELRSAKAPLGECDRDFTDAVPESVRAVGGFNLKAVADRTK